MDVYCKDFLMQTADKAAPRTNRSAAYRNRFFISNKYKLCYAGVDKAANTGMKWWMAEIEGLVPEIEKAIQDHLPGTGPKAIHSLFPMVAPHLVLDSFGRIRQIFDSKQFFCFTVVRNPFTRVFSAWADKIVAGTHIHTRKLLFDKDFYEKPVLTVKDASKSFEDFVLWLHHGAEHLRADRHWMPQFFLLRPDLLRYDFVGKLEQREELVQRLSALVGGGCPGPLQGKRIFNKTRLSYHPDFFTEQARDMISRLYADDFRAFGYDNVALPLAKAPLDTASVEKTMLTMFMKRAQSAHKKLALLEKEKDELETRPLAALRQLGKACTYPFRYSWSRLRHRI